MKNTISAHQKPYVLKKNIAYTIIVLFFLVKGIIYGVFITPPFCGTSPDDVGQISYVIYIAKEHKLPILYQTGLDAVANKCWADYRNKTAWNLKELENTYNIGKGCFEPSGSLNWITQHPPLYYLFLLPFYAFGTLFTRNLLSLTIIMRMATLVFLGCGTLIYLIKILELLNITGIAKKCILMAFLFSPAIQYFLVMVDNDSMVIFLAMLSLYLFFLYLKIGSVKSLYIFSLVCGGIVITKYTGALILPAYAIVYLYHTLRSEKYSLLRLTKQTAACLFLFGITVAPVLLRNYGLYHSLMPVFDDNTQLYNYSYFQFVAESSYIKDIYRHVTSWLGWERMIPAPECMQNMWALVLFFCFSLCVWKDKERNTCILSCAVGILMCNVFLNIDFFVGLAINALIGIFLFKFLNGRNEDNFEIRLLSILTICITVLIFFFQHYAIYLHRGVPGATHGRYYYTLIFPFFYLIFDGLENSAIKHKRIVPIIFASFLIGTEMHMQYLCLTRW